MEVLHIFGFISALIIGISLGLIGGGGSILAVPVLAYLFSVNEKVATAYSLFIVGASALVGGWKQHLKGYVDWRTAIVFGVPAIIGVTLVRHYLVPILPDVLFQIGDFEFTRRMGMFGLFAFLMIPAAFSMLKNKTEALGKSGGEVRYNYPLILVEGLLVGGITGLIGAGGGFLIIPALVILANVEMKVAVGTSLIIIAIKSLMGFFLGDAFTMDIDWQFLLIFTSLSFLGIFIGSYASNYINGEKLKKGFGYFILVMAVFIFYMEFFISH
ncbi:sulfite exporter TauE/SafE family protein [Maribacter sp. PR1]|uniref:Probable membrane transporter protein n=1 Tax=Maribacter cobaltidurans TaxID=1178778 RepID=A0ABU7IW06_9FLAO|nr:MULTISPECIES: sulfite exporter TauE/SafE family protein [Maribacter]MDC6389323.1 sulfite exporter TauE/SafE family protein [Maribacter sp. PR1]MEE1976711.1 sulfite exporter TauE/SafE family protein [Maribacter cobaltidurans]